MIDPNTRRLYFDRDLYDVKHTNIFIDNEQNILYRLNYEFQTGLLDSDFFDLSCQQQRHYLFEQERLKILFYSKI